MYADNNRRILYVSPLRLTQAVFSAVASCRAIAPRSCVSSWPLPARLSRELHPTSIQLRPNLHLPALPQEFLLEPGAEWQEEILWFAAEIRRFDASLALPGGAADDSEILETPAVQDVSEIESGENVFHGFDVREVARLCVEVNEC